MRPGREEGLETAKWGRKGPGGGGGAGQVAFLVSVAQLLQRSAGSWKPSPQGPIESSVGADRASPSPPARFRSGLCY